MKSGCCRNVNALDLANSLGAQRGRIIDTLSLRSNLRPLRDVVRALFEAAALGVEPSNGHVVLLNRLSAAPRLRWNAAGPRLADERGTAEAARTAIELLASGRIRKCANPRCVHFHLAEGTRTFCSAVCANRTRVARHARGGR